MKALALSLLALSACTATPKPTPAPTPRETYLEAKLAAEINRDTKRQWQEGARP